MANTLARISDYKINKVAELLHSFRYQTVSMDESHYLADRLPNIRLKVLDREDHLPWIGDVDAMAVEIAAFALLSERRLSSDGILATTLMTDIVGSTEFFVRSGDAQWRKLIGAHDTAAARTVARHSGTLIKTLGDGVLAMFADPSSAEACARAFQIEAANLGLSARAGIYAGKCERLGEDISGIAINLAARPLDATPEGECRVSSTVGYLVADSGLQFESAGTHTLKGIPGDWILHTVTQVWYAANSSNWLFAIIRKVRSAVVSGFKLLRSAPTTAF